MGNNAHTTGPRHLDFAFNAVLERLADGGDGRVPDPVEYAAVNAMYEFQSELMMG
jgi:hypothetical protein